MDFNTLDEKGDELKMKISQSVDQHDELELSMQLAEYLCESNPQEALEYANRTLKVAELLEDYLKQAKAHRLITHAYSKINQCEKALDHANTALTVLEKHPDKKEKYWTYLEFGRVYLYLENLELAKDYYLKTLDLAERLDITELILRSCAALAITAYKDGSFTDAKLYIIKGLARDDDGNTNNHAYLYNAVGIVYTSQGVYEESLIYYKKAIEIWERIGMHHYLGYALNNIGIVYQHLKEFQTSDEYFKQALSWFNHTQDQRNIALVYGNLGENYILKGEPTGSFNYLRKALNISQATKDKVQVAIAYYNLAWAYFEARDTPRNIKKFLNKSMELCGEINMKDLTKKVFELYSKLHLLERDIPEAMKYQSKYLEVKEELYTKDFQELARSYEKLLDQLEVLLNDNESFRSRISELEKKLDN